MVRSRRLVWMTTLFAAAAATLLILAACGSSTSAGLTPPSSGSSGEASATGGAEPAVSNSTIEVSEKEFSISPSKTTATAGKIDFKVKNDGTIPHDLAVKVDGEEHKSAMVAPGESIDFSVTITKPGDYTIYCAVPGHEAAGMKATLTVK